MMVGEGGGACQAEALRDGASASSVASVQQLAGGVQNDGLTRVVGRRTRKEGQHAGDIRARGA